MNARALAAMLAVAGTAAPAAGASAAALVPAVYAVDLNGALVSSGALVLAGAGAIVFARPDDVRSWRIAVPANVPTQSRGGQIYVSLAAIPGLRAEVDAATQTLHLRIGAAALRGSSVTLGSSERLAVERPAGGFVNYAFSQSGGAFGTTPAGEIAGGAAVAGGILTNTVAYTPGTFSRLATAWTADDPVRMRRLVVGDGVTTDVKLGSSLRYAGVSYASDFDEQPGFLTYPGVTIRGAATVPSTLDVAINNALALQRSVPAGPYALENLPVFEGAGTVAVRSTDTLGNVAQFDIPYYTARTLLAPGLQSFGYGAGFLQNGTAYGPLVVDAWRRWGITSSLTAGFSAQSGSGDTILGGSADVLAGRDGVVSLALAGNHNPRGGGAVWDAGYDYRAARLAVGGDYRVASANFTTPDPTAIAIGREVNLHATYRITRRASLQLSGARTATALGPVTLWSAGYAGATAGLPFAVTAYHAVGAGVANFGLTSTWSIGIGRRASLTPQIGMGASSAQSQLAYTGIAGDDRRSLSWDLAAGLGPAAASTVRVSAADPGGELDLDATSAPGIRGYNAAFSGGIAFLGGKAARTREVDGAFARIRVPGFAGVDVYVNGQLAGRTDAHGDLLSADLVPFVENDIRIDAARLGPTVHVDRLTATVVPPALGGVTVVFAARREAEARLTVRDAHGAPLRPGLLVRESPAGGAGPWPIGLGGHLDLIDVPAGHLTMTDGDCAFTVDVPADAGIVTLPDARCR